MKKNKGFTLIELLAVIVILGVLLSISVVAVNKIRKNQEQQNKENVISSILTGAKEYVTDNNTSTTGFLVSVNDLINNGYVDFDQVKYNDLKKSYIYNWPCASNKYKNYIYIRIFNNDKTETYYNDCGCQEQIGGDVSLKICKGK